MSLVSWCQLARSQGFVLAAFAKCQCSGRKIFKIFFLTEKQTQLFKYSIFYALSSLLTTAPVSSLFVAEDAGLVTTLMAAAHAAGKNTDI